MSKTRDGLITIGGAPPPATQQRCDPADTLSTTQLIERVAVGADWFSPKETVQMGPFGRTELFELAAEGHIKVARVVKKGNRRGKTLFSRSSIEAYIERHAATKRVASKGGGS